VFGGIYPTSSDDFQALKDAIEKLQLTDPAVSIAADSKYIV